MKKTLLITFVFLGILTPVLFVAASTTQGTVLSGTQYAWSNDIGWINFGCTNCNVQVTAGAVTGYAWSPNYGWINLGPLTNGGVENDGKGNLSGTAWGENTGWIYFSGDYICPGTQNTHPQVTINNSSGQFSGSACGDIAGIINFSCSSTGCPVTTDWRPASLENNGPASVSGGGGGGGGILLLNNGPAVPQGGFKVLINGGAAAATNNPAVNLSFNVGQDVSQIEISSSPDFSGAVPEAYSPTMPFIFSQGDGQKTVYVKFISGNGIASSVVSGTIFLDTQPPNLTVNQPQGSFNPEKDVVISGTSKPNSQIMFSWGNSYGISTTDANGNWATDLGQIPLGNYAINITAKDDAGNTKTTTINVAVGQTQNAQPETPITPAVPITPIIPNPETPAIPAAPITSGSQPSQVSQTTLSTLQSIINNVKNIFSSLAGIKKPTPQPVISIPKEVPEVLQHKWNLLPVKPQETAQ